MDQSNFIERQEEVVVPEAPLAKNKDSMGNEQVPIVTSVSSNKLKFIILGLGGLVVVIILIFILALLSNRSPSKNSSNGNKPPLTPRPTGTSEVVLDSEFARELDALEDLVEKADPRILDIKPPQLDFETQI